MGDVEGLFVGDLGPFVGDVVGPFVGDLVGLFVGDLVGLLVKLSTDLGTLSTCIFADTVTSTPPFACLSSGIEPNELAKASAIFVSLFVGLLS